MRASSKRLGAEAEREIDPPVADAFLRWPMVVALALPVIALFLLETPAEEFFFWGYGTYLLLALLFAWVTAGVAGVFIAVRAATRNGWRRAASAAIAPLLVFPTLLYLESVWSFAEEAADVAHFYVMRSAYLARVDELPGERGTRVALFYWRSTMFNAYGVFYDESDEIMRPRDERSVAWQARIEDKAGCTIGRVSRITDHVSFAKPLGEHFYFASIYWCKGF